MSAADRLMTDGVGSDVDRIDASFAYEDWAAVVKASAHAGSGDCARIISRRDGRALIFIGDVAGHDARAAGFATELDGHVWRLARWASPGALLGELNVVVETSWPSDVFVSAVCLLLDPATGRGTIAAAGQVPPIIRSASCCRAVDVRAGCALGLLAEERYLEHSFMLEDGDVLVAVTDGITDPLATGADLLGVGGLARLLDSGPLAPAAVCASVLSATRGFGLRDDATVLAIAGAFGGVMPAGLGVPGEIRLAA